MRQTFQFMRRDLDAQTLLARGDSRPACLPMPVLAWATTGEQLDGRECTVTLRPLGQALAAWVLGVIMMQ